MGKKTNTKFEVYKWLKGYHLEERQDSHHNGVEMGLPGPLEGNSRDKISPPLKISGTEASTP